MKKLFIFFSVILFTVALYGESKAVTMPVLFFQKNNFEGLNSLFYGGGIFFNYLKDKDDLSVEPEGLSVQLTYIMDYQEENALWETHKNTFNEISFQGVYNSGNHQVLLIAQDTNENPFSSRKGTVLAAGYGYQLCDNKKWSCVIGGGLFMIPVQLGSVSLPVVPLPIMRAAYKTDQVYATFDFLGNPALNCMLFTQNHLRLAANLQVTGLSSLRDISGQVAFRYYFLPEHEIWQVLNLQLGLENTVMPYTLKNEKNYTSQNWGIFTAIDVTVIKIQAGYSFDGVQKIDNKVTGKTGQGWYCSVQAAFVF